MFLDVFAVIFGLIGGGCIDTGRCFSTQGEGTIIVENGDTPPPPAPREGGIVVQKAPKAKANPTWICPDGSSNPPNLC